MVKHPSNSLKENMFRQRLLTILVLVPLVLLILFYGNKLIFTSIILALVLGCAWEWLALIPLQKRWAQFAFILLALLLVWFFYYGFCFWLVVTGMLWILILLAVLFFPASQRVWGYAGVVAFAGLIVLPSFGQSMISLYDLREGKAFIFYLLLLVWAADIGAYLAGKQWGRRKLIPFVSPGKTIEGSVGGALLSMLVAILGYFYFRPAVPLAWFIIAMATMLISILGDLFISILKRRAKLKDTGHLLPGHGGVLDRLDSLLAASPLFYCGLYGSDWIKIWY
jgi:phosphatidate cytidylyltransferase